MSAFGLPKHLGESPSTTASSSPKHEAHVSPPTQGEPPSTSSSDGASSLVTPPPDVATSSSIAAHPEVSSPPSPQKAAVPQSTLQDSPTAALPNHTPLAAPPSTSDSPPFAATPPFVSQWPAVGEKFRCYISHFDSPRFFHLVPERSECSKIVAALVKVKGQGVESVKEGGAALAWYEDQWCRVVYEGRGPSVDTHRVYYVDSGHRDTVSTLTAIPAERSKIPRQAIPCSLHDTCIDDRSFEDYYYKLLIAEVLVSSMMIITAS